jgi:IclR family transcriptional regulator, mhp operon transcriptional activator
MGEHPPRDSTRPIRALNRGLEVLVELNKLERAAINTLAAAVRLPRTTTFRILETLRSAGFVERDQYDYYRPALKVRTLSDGFDDEALIGHIAKPLLGKLGERLTWPVAVATPAGATMLIRETTQNQASVPPLEHHGAGVRVPMLASAAGRAYLAHCPAPQRDALLELLSRSSLPEDRLARNRAEVERLLNETRSQGYGIAHRARRAGEETSLAVPIRAKERIVAAVMVRFVASAMPLRSAVEQFIPRIRELAQSIEAAMS